MNGHIESWLVENIDQANTPKQVPMSRLDDLDVVIKETRQNIRAAFTARKPVKATVLRHEDVE